MLKDAKITSALSSRIGQHENSPLVDDLKTHRASVGNDATISNPTFEEQKNLSFGIAGLYERNLTPKDRLGVRIGVQSIGIGHLEENFTATEQFLGIPVSGTITREFSVNGSQRFLSVYYRRLFGEKMYFSPFVGSGFSHLRATVDIDETDYGSVFVGTGDQFSENYEPQERWVPHFLAGFDVLFKATPKLNYGLGLSIEHLFNAEFSGFKTQSQELVMVNGRLVSVPIGSGQGRSFKADFTGTIVNLTLKILY